MANPVELFIFSILDLLKGSLFLAIPIFLAMLAGKWLREKISKKTKWSWLLSALAATYGIVWVLVLILYFTPFLLALQESGLGQVPSMFAPPAGAVAASYISGLFKVTISALVISLLLMPLELIGAFINEFVNRKLPKANPLASLFITAYIASFVCAAIILFIIPEAITGLLFYIYYG